MAAKFVNVNNRLTSAKRYMTASILAIVYSKPPVLTGYASVCGNS